MAMLHHNGKQQRSLVCEGGGVSVCYMDRAWGIVSRWFSAFGTRDVVMLQKALPCCFSIIIPVSIVR